MLKGAVDLMPSDEYFRGDQRAGITAPDPSKQCELHEHVVRTRGRKTGYTSVSLDKHAIEIFGECFYRLNQERAIEDGHRFVEHASLIDTLRRTALEGEKAERLTAVQALRYAKMRKEGIVCWMFNCSGVERKDLITWAGRKVQDYFDRCQHG